MFGDLSAAIALFNGVGLAFLGDVAVGTEFVIGTAEYDPEESLFLGKSGE